MHRAYPGELEEERTREFIPPLENGDHLSREEFERRYHAMPNLKKAELIDGVVYMPSLLRFRHHGRPSRILSTWMGTYEAATPGVEGADNATLRLDPESEPQPDGLLMISSRCGGQAAIDEDDYVSGAPELAVEAAASSASYDLHEKLEAYRRNGVLEYLVWRVLDREVDWFKLHGQDYVRLAADEQGIIRSEVFPGLWLDTQGLLAFDLRRVLEVLQQGIASAEHAAFVARLQAAG
jgi:Uma2 family endonuclease